MRARTGQLGVAIGGGLVAGLIAGIVLSVYMLLMSAVQGTDVWLVVKGAGTPFLGRRALAPGFDFGSVFVGAASHLAVSATWGALFGLLFRGESDRVTLVAGLFWGIAVWLGMYYVLLPLLGLAALVRSVPVHMAILQHVLFGALLGVAFLPFQRLAARRGPPRASGGATGAKAG